jgi:hypothetical protein
MYLNAYPNAKFEPYTCGKCKEKCSALVDNKYCLKCFINLDKEGDQVGH